MNAVSLNNETVSEIYSDCYDTLLDKNIRDGVYTASEDDSDYLIFDKDYLSYANKLVFLSIACVYNNDLFFTDDLEETSSAINLASHMEKNKVVFDNKKACMDKKYWYIKLSRKHEWALKFRAQAAFLYYASVFLRQNPLTLTGNLDKKTISSWDTDDYERYLEYPEDLEPYSLFVRLDDWHKDYKNPYKVVIHKMKLNESETLEDIIEQGDEYLGSHFEEEDKVFILNPNPVLKYYNKYKKERTVGGNKI